MVPFRRRQALAILAALVVVGSAVAEPLPKEDCDKLSAEQTALDQSGIKELLAKGADWGRGNLERAKLRLIERYITVDEQLSFRCGLAKTRFALPFSEEDTPPANPDDVKDAKGDAVDLVPKPKPKPKPKAVAPAEPQDAKAAPPPKPKPKPAPAAEIKEPAPTRATPKPKPKADDAYRPPAPGNATGDPFAKQLKTQ